MPATYDDAMKRLRHALSSVQHSRQATDLTGLSLVMHPDTHQEILHSAKRGDRRYPLMNIPVKSMDCLEPGEMFLIRTVRL